MKRHAKFFIIWGALALVAFFIAGQIWYEAIFEAGEGHHRFATTGLDSWPFVNSILWLSVAGILAVAFTANLTRTILLWALTAMNFAQVVLFFNQGLMNRTPPSIAHEIEHRTGIAFDNDGMAHDVFRSLQVSIWPYVFVAALILMVVTTGWAAVASVKWAKQDSRSRFEPGTTGDTNDQTDGNDDDASPIDIWDSQRK